MLPEFLVNEVSKLIMIKLINSYLLFSHFFLTTLLQLGVYDNKRFMLISSCDSKF